MAQLPNVTSVTIPESITAITNDTFTDCPRLASITVAQNNPTYASLDGVLYNKDLTRILLFPGGTEGVVTLPDQIDAVPASALSHSANLFALLVGQSNAAFSTINGSLYSKDAFTLVACPGGIGETLTLPKQTSTIGPNALAGITTLKSIVVLGNITTIDPTAFNDQAKQSTTIALPGGEDYETRKAVWQSAGFKNFATPANPGDTQTPDQPGEGTQPSNPDNPTDPSKPASGFTYKLLEDYTLEASWTGELSSASTPSISTTAQLAGVSYTVSALAPAAFENQTALTAITLPSSLTTLGARAFAGTSLKSIDIPTSITTIGDQAFANCPNLARIITHTNTIQVAPTALEACTNLELWCPYNVSETYPWVIGLFATNNHIKAYGLPASQQPLTLEVGQSANLFEPNTLQAPDPSKAVYAYEATCLSVSQEGTITAKAPGTTTITTTLELEEIPLTHTTRTITITAPTTPEQPPALDQPEPPTPTPPNAQPITPRYPPNLATPTQASAPLYSRGGIQPRAVTNWDVDVSIESAISIDATGTSSPTPGKITSKMPEPIRVTQIKCAEAGAASLLSNPDDRAATKVNVTDGTTFASLALSGTGSTWPQTLDPKSAHFRVPAGSPTPADLSITFGLDIPKTATYNYLGSTAASFATVTSTFDFLAPVATSLDLSSTAPKVGDTLTATPATQVPGIKSTYTWYALDNAGETPTPAKVIPGTSSNSCKLTDLQKGKIICCALSDGPIDDSAVWNYRPVYSVETAPVAPGPPPIKDTLEKYSWEELSKVADDLSVNKTGSTYFTTFENFMKNDYQKSIAGTNMPNVRIVGINHDDKVVASGKPAEKAGLTFMATHSLPKAYRFNPQNFPNTSYPEGSSLGGWEKSELRTVMNSGAVWNTLPTDLKVVIKSVNKKSNNVRGGPMSNPITLTPDKLWLPSYSELINNGSSNWASYTWLSEEGSQYEFFRGKVTGGNIDSVLGGMYKTQNGSRPTDANYTSWWERSCYPGYDGLALQCFVNGYPFGNDFVFYPLGVVPAFCL